MNTKRRYNTMGLAGALFALALAAVPSAVAQRQMSAQISVNIRTEASLDASRMDAVRVKIRLAPGTNALVWTAQDSCTTPSMTGRSIASSGTYDIPTSDLGSGNRVCVASSDGSIRLSDLRR